MNRLVQDYFERDLTPREEARLHKLLQSSEAAALEFSREAEKRYAALGLTAAALLLAKGGASKVALPASGWVSKAVVALKAMTLKTALTSVVATVVVGGVAVTAVKLLPQRPVSASTPVAETAPALMPVKAAASPQSGDGLAITLELAKARELSVTIFDAKGRPVRHFASQRYEAGVQRLLWDGLDDGKFAVVAGRYRVAVDLGSKTMERWLEVR